MGLVWCQWLELFAEVIVRITAPFSKITQIEAQILLKEGGTNNMPRLLHLGTEGKVIDKVTVHDNNTVVIVSRIVLANQLEAQNAPQIVSPGPSGIPGRFGEHGSSSSSISTPSSTPTSSNDEGYMPSDSPPLKKCGDCKFETESAEELKLHLESCLGRSERLQRERPSEQCKFIHATIQHKCVNSFFLVRNR